MGISYLFDSRYLLIFNEFFHIINIEILSETFAGSPWDVKDKSGKDGGNKLLSVILTTGWLTNIYRSTMLNYHSALRGILERSKDRYRNKKLEQIKKWEDIALNAAAEPTNVRNRKNLRQKLALLLEEYVTLFEDQPLLIGPRILLILTLLAQATSEINWLVVHQNGQMPKKKKEAEQCLYTTQETVSIIYFSNKLKGLIMDNRDLLRVYIVETLKGQEMMEIHEKVSQMDVSREVMDDVKKVVNNISNLSLEEGLDEIKINSQVHFYDIGRLITSLSMSQLTTTSSCPVQMNPQMTEKLEISCLHLALLTDLEMAVRKPSNMTFLYFFKDTLEDYFSFVFQIPYNIGYIIAFPEMCQDFTSVVHKMCSEEQEFILHDVFKLTNNFFEKMAEKAVENLDEYTQEIIFMEKKIQPHFVAEKFSAGEREFRSRKAAENIEQGSTNKKANKAKHQGDKVIVEEKREHVRTNLFETRIEILTMGLQELLNVFMSRPPIQIASYSFFPESFLLDKVSDKIIERMKSFYNFSHLPSEIKLDINTYMHTLINLDPGLNFAQLGNDILYNMRSGTVNIFTNMYLSHTYNLGPMMSL